jgi:hypothetical protein
MRLVSYFGDADAVPAELPKGGEAAQHNNRRAALTASGASVEYIEIYCFLLIQRDSKDARVAEMAEAIRKQSKEPAASADLTRVGEVKSAIQKLGGRFPPALRRYERGR